MKYLSKSKGLLVLILSVLLMFTLVGCGNSNGDEPEETPPMDTATGELGWDVFNARAVEFVELMVAGDFSTATAMFNEEIAAAVDVATLETVWQQHIVGQAGAFIAVYGTENYEEEGLYVVLITSAHENMGVLLNIKFSEDGLIAGFTLDGFPILDEVEPIETIGFTNYPIIIGEGTNWPLAGMLSIPDDTSVPVPAVVIVHGSGQHNMDGQVGETTPYLDIAEFLVTNGIAVIRYDKRTYTHAVRLYAEIGNRMTFWEETVEDAVLAAELLRNDPRIDPDRVYIIGHSLGGVLAPRIHENGGDFAGLIMMGATSRSVLNIAAEQLGQVALEQIEMGIVERTDPAIIEGLEMIDEIIALDAAMVAMSAEEAQNTIAPLIGSSLYYWRDLVIHSFERYVQDVTVPMLVMQGGRDFQILADLDFVLLQEILAGRDNVTFRLYEDLNHAFIPTTATNFLEHAASMAEAGHVGQTALQDIVDWILR